MQQINLYQEQFRTRRDPLDARHMGIMLVLLVVALGAVSVWLQQRAGELAERAAAVERERDRLEQQVLAMSARLEERRGEAAAGDDRLVRLRRELAAKQRVLEYLESGPMARRDGFSTHLAGLARRVIDGLWFDRIVFEHGGGKLRFEGHSLQPDGVPRMIEALAAEEVYAGHAFRSLVIERTGEGGDRRVDFVLASDRPDSTGEERQ